MKTSKVSREILSGEGIKKTVGYQIDPTLIMIDDELNPRIDYGDGDDWDSFKESIRDYGLQQNIKVYYNEDDGKFHLVHGFRRMKAIMELLAEDTDQIKEKLELIGVDIVENNKEEAIISHFTLNSGKPLTDAEMAEGVLRLKKFGGITKVAELARKVGLPYQKVNMLLTFAEMASSQVKKAVNTGEMAFTTAVNGIINKSGSITEQNTLLKEAKTRAKESGKTKVRISSISKEEKENLETKIGNLIAEASADESVPTETLEMFKSIIKALKDDVEIENILGYFKIEETA